MNKYSCLFVLLALCALSACNDDNPEVVGDTSPTPVDTGATDGGTFDVPDPDVSTNACASNADCAGGEICQDGTCQAFCTSSDDCAAPTPICDAAGRVCVACTADSDCGEGATCQDNACVSGCTSNSECAGGELCIDNVCAPFCTADEDCTGGDVCTDNVCEPAAEGCTENSECAGGERCEDGACISIDDECVTGAAECTGNGTGRTCEDGSWTEFVCSDEWVCENGTCHPPLGDECDPGTPRECDGDNIVICDSSGTITATIACGDTCEDGECIELPCTDDDNFCIDDRIIARCNPDADVFFQEECHPQLVCDDGDCVFEDGENVCGGDEVLDQLPGEACGDCGAVVCNPDDGNAPGCDDPGLNECGGCGTIDVTLGEECGECGTWACGDDGSVICSDPGFNACGWCGDLEEEVGGACGDCGVWACEEGGWLTERGVTCEDPGANRCGGCTELATFPGDLCEDSDEVYVCDGDDGLSCQTNRTDSCFTAIECNIFAGQFGIVDPLALACDGDVGCYRKGHCSPDGIPTEYDPFGSACVGGSECTVVPAVGWQLCTGCTVGDDSTCRDGEVCEEILFGLFSVCNDPLSLIP